MSTRCRARWLTATSSRAESRDLPNSEDVTQVGEILRSEPDGHIAQDDTVMV
jgi:hypothetical protein